MAIKLLGIGMNRRIDSTPMHGNGSLEMTTEIVDSMRPRGMRFILFVFCRDEGRCGQVAAFL
jgi:hypothetical protein